MSDPGRVWTWADAPHYRPQEFCKRLFAGESCATSSQHKPALDAIFKKIERRGNLVWVFDEARYFGSQGSALPWVVKVARTFRHRKVGLIFVTQKINDINGDILDCVSEVHCGRITSPRRLQFLSEEWGFDPDELMALPENEFIVERVGF